MRTSLAIVFVSAAGAVAPVAAQGRWFPTVVPFEYPSAAPGPSGIVGRVIWVRRPETQFGPEQEGDVAIGENVPVLRLGRGETPSFLGLTIRVTGRFSLDDPKSSLISNDWVVGAHAVTDRGPTRWALELFHESSHLGDEYAERFGARRSDWSREALAGWVRHRVGSFNVTGHGSYTVLGGRGVAPAAAGLGLGYRSPRRGTIVPEVAIFSEALQEAGWKFTTSARAGIDIVGTTGRLGVGVVYLNGLSSQRQFFGVKSRYYGVELRFDF